MMGAQRHPEGGSRNGRLFCPTCDENQSSGLSEVRTELNLALAAPSNELRDILHLLAMLTKLLLALVPSLPRLLHTTTPL